MTSAVSRLAAIEPSLWKNGGGTTRQLLRHPPDASLDDFLVRVSVADVASDGPFSVYLGVRRHLLLLTGSIELARGDGRLETLVERDRVVEFDGDEQISARVLSQPLPVRDFNVMVRAANCSAKVTLVRSAAVLPAPELQQLMIVAFCVSGRWRVGALELAPDEFVVLRDDDCAAELAIAPADQPTDRDLLIVAQITAPRS